MAAWRHVAAIGVDIRHTYADVLTSPNSPQVLKKIMGALTLDVRALLATVLSHEGPNPFAEVISAIEGAQRAGGGRARSCPA